MNIIETFTRSADVGNTAHHRVPKNSYEGSSTETVAFQVYEILKINHEFLQFLPDYVVEEWYCVWSCCTFSFVPSFLPHTTAGI